MDVLQNIERNAYKYNIKTERINSYTMKLYSDKYMFDSWLVEKDGDILRLKHMNRKLRCGKCTYHLQKNIKAKNWRWVLQRINAHNKYVVSRKWNAKENMVDRVMRKYKEGKYNNGCKR